MGLEGPSAGAKSAGRSSIDILVQNATVQVFQTYGVAVAPIARTPNASLSYDRSELAGTITFSFAGTQGSMLLCVPLPVLTLMKNDLSDASHALDWIRELTNQLMGRIKNRLLRFQVDLRLGMPTSAKAEHLLGRSRMASPPALYQFRSMRGDVSVALHDMVDESRLRYSGVDLASEGDILLF